jgi:hypothetical protein
MSPWELGATYVLLPVLVLMAWVIERTNTDGAPAPEFEAWFRATQPVLFALRCAPGESNRVKANLVRAFGPRLQIEHHRGRYPWTRYLFVVAIEQDEKLDVIRIRAKTCAIRRMKETRPEIGSIVDEVARDFATSVTALWVHAELREEDDECDANRRERGWIATIEGGARGAFAPTLGLPAWALV